LIGNFHDIANLQVKQIRLAVNQTVQSVGIGADHGGVWFKNVSNGQIGLAQWENKPWTKGNVQVVWVQVFALASSEEQADGAQNQNSPFFGV
jgi:hypothetical protein